MAWGTIVGLALGAAQNYEANKSYIKQLGYETEGKIAGINATKDAYLADLDALVIESYINRELANNAAVEARRAGGANVREAQVAIKQGESKLQAQNEGITGGSSKAREISAFYVQASKEVNKLQESTTKQVIQIADNLEKANNELNAAAERSYNNMLLSLAGVSPYSSIQPPSASAAASNLMQGAQMGTQFGQNMGDLFASNSVV